LEGVTSGGLAVDRHLQLDLRLGLAGLLNAYLGAPGSVAGSQTVELTLEAISCSARCPSGRFWSAW
jgi:hypothetical protein